MSWHTTKVLRSKLPAAFCSLLLIIRGDRLAGCSDGVLVQVSRLALQKKKIFFLCCFMHGPSNEFWADSGLWRCVCLKLQLLLLLSSHLECDCSQLKLQCFIWELYSTL